MKSPRARLSILLGFALALASTTAGRDTLDIYWIDSEGGGSTLLVTPAGESVLIDTGNPGGRDAARIHRVATETAGLRRIDHVIITHFHIDHFGGLAELAEMMPVGALYDKGIADASPDSGRNEARWALTSRPYRAAPVERRELLRAGGALTLRQSADAAAVSIRCLVADQEVVPPPAGAKAGPDAAGTPEKPVDTSDNANSIVSLIEFGPFRFFNGGDLTWNVEARLVSPVNIPGPVDLYQVNHHGLDSSNNPLLLLALDPVVAVFNNGPKKGTSQTAFDSLRGAPSLQAIYQVHENIRPDDPHNNTERERIANAGDRGEECAGHFIHCSVAADGASYTLAVPSTGHRQTFQTRSR
jgi:competence protein ComEC